MQVAQEGRLGNFGVAPTFPEIGYGYMKARGHDPARPVERFVEKHGLNASRYLKEMVQYAPAIELAARKV